MIELHPAAEAELAEAANWYDRRRDGLGDRFLSAVEAAAERIERAALEGPLWTRPDVPPGVRRVHVDRFPYALIYVTEPRLLVVAFAHDRRRPGYWRGRMTAGR